MRTVMRRLAAPIAGLLAAGLAYVGVDLSAEQQAEITAALVVILSVVGGAVWAVLEAVLRRKLDR